MPPPSMGWGGVGGVFGLPGVYICYNMYMYISVRVCVCVGVYTIHREGQRLTEWGVWGF